MNKKTFTIIFIIFAVLVFVTLAFHIKEIFSPSEKTPALRHAIFIVINITCIYGVIKRPKWFLGFIALLSLQQWYSHGSYLIELWQTQHRIHWISIGIIVLLPALFVLLVLERRNNKP